MSLHTRTDILLGRETRQYLSERHILIAGIGGVGGYVAENLARAGIGQLTLIDSDSVDVSNGNRQLVALQSTIGQKKTAVMRARIADINPAIAVHCIDDFITIENAKQMIAGHRYDFIADCIDTIACKAQLVVEAQQQKTPIISAMGAGNCIDPNRVRVARLDKTQGCPLAREMRRKLREQRANLKYPVIYTDEQRRTPQTERHDSGFHQKTTNGTIAYMPALFGVLLAGELLRLLITHHEQSQSLT